MAYANVDITLEINGPESICPNQSGTGGDGAYDYTASASDGTAPYTYAWESVKNSDANTASIDSPSDSVTISCTATDDTGGFEWERKYDDGSWQALTDECDETVTLEATESPGKYQYRARPYGSTSADDWQLSDDVYIFTVAFENDTVSGRDTDDIQIQYFTNLNHSGNFEYTAILLQIYYNIEPGIGWIPDSVQLKIKNPVGSVVRTIDLPTTIDQQATIWDSKDDAGNYVPFGNDYKAELEVTVGSMTCVDAHEFDEYEIRQANSVYRPIPLNEHVAILYEYNGGNGLSQLQNLNNYTVMQHPGTGGVTNPSNLGNYNNWIGFYCPNGLSRSQREAILEKCHQLDGENIPYVSFPYLDTLTHDDGTTSPAGTDWAGSVADIEKARCDGTVEVAYEDCGVALYGGSTWWNIMTPGAHSGSNLDRHNDGDDSINPQRQRTSALTRNSPDAMYLPQP